MYTTLRTLLPLIASAHPLTRRKIGTAIGPFAPPPTSSAFDGSNELKLKSAQRFSTYLAVGDIAAVCVLVWEAGVSTPRDRHLGETTAGGSSRLLFVCTVRPTLMLAVAAISYVNVIRGTSIQLGKADCVSSARSHRGPSIESDAAQQQDHLRSTTPHSATRLLSNTLRPSISRSSESSIYLASFQDAMSAFDFDPPSTNRNDHEVLSFDIVSRPSVGSLTSSSTQATGARGCVSSSSSRDDALRQVWGRSPAPGTGHSAISVELSSSEARGAMLRLGGHLLSSVLLVAFVSPFITALACRRKPSLVCAILLVFGICQPSLVLLLQCWASEGFWFSNETSPPLKSSAAADFADNETKVSCDKRGPSLEDVLNLPRSTSAMSTYYAYSKSNTTLPGIDPHGLDCRPESKTSFGRALSMVQTHPKLLVLSNVTDESSVSTATTSATASHARSHLRLRSLTLPKTLAQSATSHAVSRSMDSSAVTVPSATVIAANGRASPVPLRTVGNDEAITKALLTTKKGQDDDAPRNCAVDTENLSNDLSIDFLSSKVLPRLVPSVVIGSSTIVRPESSTQSQTREVVEANWTSTRNRSETIPFGYPFNRPPRNVRNLSLPILSVTKASTIGSRMDEESLRSSEQSPATPSKKRLSLDRRGIDDDGNEEKQISSDSRISWSSLESDSFDNLQQEDNTISSTASSISLAQDDVHTSTIQCATVKPIGRNSTSVHGDDKALGRKSLDSTRSLGRLTDRTNLTAQGFRNTLNTGGYSNFPLLKTVQV
ncbi:hypothetical protein OIO90_000813 [Microbotryomycetes sp. JL221]|nr:hypothetical protein OIO90_000813 [Microbotryomycetes sp. JL221]